MASKFSVRTVHVDAWLTSQLKVALTHKATWVIEVLVLLCLTCNL